MGGPLTTADMYIQDHEETTRSTVCLFCSLLFTLAKPFHHINNLNQDINFTMEEGRNGELAFCDTLLK